MDKDQKNLESLYESVLLLEMPHVEFFVNGKSHLFDFRTEDFVKDGNWVGLAQRVKQYLSQFEEPDKERAKQELFAPFEKNEAGLQEHPFDFDRFFSKYPNPRYGMTYEIFKGMI